METIGTLIEEFKDDAKAIRREIHRHPETAMNEAATTALIKRKLSEYGLELADVELPSGAAAILEGKKSGKTILLRADIDALPMEEKSGLPFASEHPGVCHSCGHDIHTAALLLAAHVLSRMKDKLAGTVIVLFQPAEESLSGSQLVLQSGLFEKYKPQLAVGIHCWPELQAGTIGIRKGSFMASSDALKLKVIGSGGHGAHPHKSVDPIMAAAYILTELQTVVSRSVAPLDSAVITIGKIAGGTAGNVIPDEVVMEGTVRTVNNETRAMVEEKIRTVTDYGAKALGASCEVEYTRGVPAVYCDSQTVDLIEKAAVCELGSENVVTLDTPSMGSEDFARYLELVPGAMFRVGTAFDDPASRRPLHNAGILFDERAICTGAAVFSRTAIDYLTE